MSSLTGATALAAGAYFNCAIVSGGTVECWGDNSVGELGRSPSTTGATATPVQVSGLSGASGVAAGNSFACAVIGPNGRVGMLGGQQLRTAWGEERGRGPTVVTPARARRLRLRCPRCRGVSAIAAGGLHACALLTNGTVQCWGDNSDGQLGSMTPADAGNCPGSASPCPATPTPVPGISGVTAVAAGEYHTCVLLTGGTVECWGDNSYGALGNGSSCYPDRKQSVPDRAGDRSPGCPGSRQSRLEGATRALSLSSEAASSAGETTPTVRLGNGTSTGPGTCKAGGTSVACSTTPVAVSGL